MLQQLGGARVFLVDLLQGWAQRLAEVVNRVAGAATCPVAEEDKLSALPITLECQDSLRVDRRAECLAAL